MSNNILNLINYMLNKDETTYFEFTNSLNSNNFQLVGQADIRKLIDELKQKGKVCEQVHMDDDMCKALGLRILKNQLMVGGNSIDIYMFISQRFPQQIPIIYLSQSVVKTENQAQEVYRWQPPNTEELKIGGVFNICLVLEKVQLDIQRRGYKPKFASDLAALKETFNINEVFKQLSQLRLQNLVQDTRNPSAAEISQQFKLTKEYLTAANFFSQLTQLNDSIIKYLREKIVTIDSLKKKNLHYCYELEKSKKQFASACVALQAIKDRYSKLSIMSLMDDKITRLKNRTEEISRLPFSPELFNEFKTAMKQLKAMELKKQKLL